MAGDAAGQRQSRRANDGTVNAHDTETITTRYADPHAGHGERSVDAAVYCRTRLEDGGYITAGGCEAGQGGEFYRDYMDGGEYISYTFGIYNPPTATALTDIVGRAGRHRPGRRQGDDLQPDRPHRRPRARAADGAGLHALHRPEHRRAGPADERDRFNLQVTSAADGLTVPQVITQRHLLQTDDTIVTEGQCLNFEAGTQGFVEAEDRVPVHLQSPSTAAP